MSLVHGRGIASGFLFLSLVASPAPATQGFPFLAGPFCVTVCSQHHHRPLALVSCPVFSLSPSPSLLASSLHFASGLVSQLSARFLFLALSPFRIFVSALVLGNRFRSRRVPRSGSASLLFSIPGLGLGLGPGRDGSRILRFSRFRSHDLVLCTLACSTCCSLTRTCSGYPAQGFGGAGIGGFQQQPSQNGGGYGGQGYGGQGY